MKTPTRIAIVVATVAITLLVGVFVHDRVTAPDPVEAADRSSVAVRDDSRRLGTPGDGSVTLVEFLDLECESCAAAYPFVEQLRERYEGRVTFVVRYFPLPGHRNADNAARAVEAAGRQDAFEPMYRRMYETQAEWGESQDSQAALFRTWAEELGLDLATYDADVASPEVAARVQRDVDDGLALGVTGTPSFFLNGERLTPSTTDEFVQAIEDALAG